MAITIKSKKEIETLKQGGKILADILREVSEIAKPGVSTGFLNDMAKKLVLSYGAKPAFEGYLPSFSKKPYPAAICISLNEVVVHGLPSSNVILKEGDILKLDFGVTYEKFITDAAITIGIGKMTEEKTKLINATERALELAIEEIKPGNHIGNIGFVIERHIESQGFSVVRDLVGHGVGYEVHEEPNIPNYGKKGEGPQLQAGMVLAIEPIVTMGSGQVRLGQDGFGYETVDGSLSAHFEHTVAVTEGGNEVLTK